MLLLAGFTASMFLASALLFVVEPMLAKMALPLVGGTPAVWNTCLVFFQAALLMGYLYAHASRAWLGRRAQAVVHLALVSLPLVPLGMLPLRLSTAWLPPASSNPSLWILATLAAAVGVPFVALASNAPVLQRWFADSGHAGAADPYFLYAASNAGSLAGLFAYPLLIEPSLRVSQQSRLWSEGYVLFVVMTAACALAAWRGGRVPDREPATESAGDGGWSERLRWIALAFAPSSLMLGVTTAITTDVSTMPLFWVLPLATYLLSFVLAFARRPIVSHVWMVRRLPFLILVGLFPFVSRMRLPLAILAPLYLGLLFGVSMVCHGELARRRPHVGRLTEFYLLVSIGGVIGGIFNAIIAPVVFRSALEFPIAIVIAALLRPALDVKALTKSAARLARRNDWLWPAALGLTVSGVIVGLSRAGITIGYTLTVLIFGDSMIWCLSFGRRPRRFALGTVALLIASSLYTGPLGRVLETDRSYFGVYRVTNDPSGRFRYLVSGGTLHGMQSLDPARRSEPLAYYTRTGPAGQIARAVRARSAPGQWAIVGLGAGAMACLSAPGQGVTFYEIDPLVARLATDGRYFTFLQECQPSAGIVLGDARLEIANAADGQFALIVLDAFSGDAIPIHLMTREAVALYLRKLAPGGVIAFHISSLYVQLAPTLARLAEDAHLASLAAVDRVRSKAEADTGKSDSHWLVMARSEADLAGLTIDVSRPGGWQPVQADDRAKVWTDDYSNLLSVIKWGGFIRGDQ